MGVNPVLSEGQEAPLFELETYGGEVIKLEDLRGAPVILYFYPKDMTPGCTTQACDFRDAHAPLNQAGYQVFGVSPDPVARHEAFRDKHDLNFPLRADEDHAVAQAYGVWREKSNYGRTYMGIVRSTFVIDEEGKIAKIMDNVRAKGHVAKLLREVVE